LQEVFPLAYAYIERIKANPAEIIREVPGTARRGSRAQPPPPNVAVAINEYILINLVNQSLPKPKDKCSDWKEALGGLVRGRTCSWSNVWGTQIDIRDASITGGVRFSFGGRADGCVHVWIPWKCRWEWECASIGISFRGAPSVTVNFSEKRKEGLVFWLDIDARNVEVNVIAPFPLNVVLTLFAQILISFVLAIVALVASLTTFQFVPPLIEIKEQNTKLKFSGFEAFGYQRAQALPKEKKTFLAFACQLEARE
jgi:hypothetical protein